MMLSKVLFALFLTATSAFQQSRVERAVNFLRDDVVDASHVIPPLMSAQAVSYVINWHRSVIAIVNTATPGWEQIVSAKLDTLLEDLGASNKPLLQPDVDFIKQLMR